LKEDERRRRRRGGRGAEKEREIIMLYHLFSLFASSPQRREQRSLLNEIPEDASMQSVDPGFRHLSHRIFSSSSSLLVFDPSSPSSPVLADFVRSRREEAIKRTLTRRGTREQEDALSIFCSLHKHSF
jgi:hypothetical protein